MLLDYWNEKICKNPLNVTIVPKGVTFNDDIGENSDDDSDDEGGDEGDFCSHDGGGEMHDTFFDVDFLETDQIEVGTSKTKLQMIHNVKVVSIEAERGSGVLVEGVSEPAEDFTQPAKGDWQPTKSAS